MKNISELDHCYGCGVCTAVCPVDIISMRMNKDGFYEPFIAEHERCIDCGMCLKVCSFANNGVAGETETPVAYAAWSNYGEERVEASSGGVSAALVRHAMRHNPGKCRMAGVRYNPAERRAEHFIATTESEAKEAMGSKYLQSFTEDAFRAIDLKDKDLKWIVSGTPCQIDSMRRLLNARRANGRFLLIDFFCHGVPSRLVWLRYLAERGLSTALDISWRNKKDGWQQPFAITAFRPDRSVESRSTQAGGDMFFKMFFSNNCLNKCCYADCKFKSLNSAADIRIGDFWSKDFEAEREGVSVAVAMTGAGKAAMESLTDDCTLCPVAVDSATEGQMKKPMKEPRAVRRLTLAMLRAGLPLKPVHMLSRLARHL